MQIDPKSYDLCDPWFHVRTWLQYTVIQSSTNLRRYFLYIVQLQSIDIK